MTFPGCDTYLGVGRTPNLVEGTGWEIGSVEGKFFLGGGRTLKVKEQQSRDRRSDMRSCVLFHQ